MSIHSFPNLLSFPPPSLYLLSLPTENYFTSPHLPSWISACLTTHFYLLDLTSILLASSAQPLILCQNLSGFDFTGLAIWLSPHIHLPNLLRFTTFSDCLKYNDAGNCRNHSEPLNWNENSLVLCGWPSGPQETWQVPGLEILGKSVEPCLLQMNSLGLSPQNLLFFVFSFFVWKRSLNECASCTVISLTFK